MIRAKTRAEEIFLIVTGYVQNESTQRIFSKGSIIGETDIIMKRVSQYINTLTIFKIISIVDVKI